MLHLVNEVRHCSQECDDFGLSGLAIEVQELMLLSGIREVAAGWLDREVDTLESIPIQHFDAACVLFEEGEGVVELILAFLESSHRLL